MTIPDQRGVAQPWRGPVRGGQLPPMATAVAPRPETGLSLTSPLPLGQTTVLASAAGPASQSPYPLGGTGKTHLAAALAHAHAASGMAGGVVWVSATGRDAVISGYAQALPEFGAGGDPEQAAAQFLEQLPRAGLPVLVVLDDLADAAVMDGLWPDPERAFVLVTTERPETALRAWNPRVAEIGPYSPREASAYLMEALHEDPDQRIGALDLAADLGYLPVTLRLAAAFMTATRMDCRSYREYLAERSGRWAAPEGYAPTVSAAWSLAAELTERMDSGLARRALGLLSMLAPQGVPVEVLLSPAARAYLGGPLMGGPADEPDAQLAVENLARAGLVTIASQWGLIHTHPVVQAITRQNLSSADYGRAAQAAADAVSQAWSHADPGQGLDAALRACVARLQDTGGRSLWSDGCHPALLRTGHSLDAAGLKGPAFSYWQALFGISQRVLGPDHAQTQAIRDRFGDACAAAGRHGEAITLLEAALADYERTLGIGHPDTVAARSSLALAYRAAGRGDDAVRLAEVTLDYCERRLGPSHQDTLAAQMGVARAYLGAGRVDDAVAAFQQALADLESSLGPGHADTMAARQELAAAFRAAGRPKDAVTLYERGLAERQRQQGPGHPDTMTAREDLARAYLMAGRVKDAVAQLRRSLADREQTSGPDNLETAATRAVLASAYRAAKKIKDAIPLYERALADRERLQGADHLDTINARSELAVAYHSARKLAMAIPQYERALADCQRVLGPDHPLTQAARQSLNAAAADARSVLGIDLRSAR